MHDVSVFEDYARDGSWSGLPVVAVSLSLEGKIKTSPLETANEIIELHPTIVIFSSAGKNRIIGCREWVMSVVSKVLQLCSNSAWSFIFKIDNTEDIIPFVNLMHETISKGAAFIHLEIAPPSSIDFPMNEMGNLMELTLNDETFFDISNKTDYEFAKKVITELQLPNATIRASKSLHRLGSWMKKDGLSARQQWW